MQIENGELIGQRLANAHSFQCDSLAGMEVEKFLGFYGGDDHNGMSMIALKLKEKRIVAAIFLDAAIGLVKPN